MVSNNKNLQNLIPSSSKTLTIATTSSDTEDKEKNPNATSLMDSSESITPITIDGAEEDAILLDSAFLTRHEVNRRRLRRTKQLVRIFKDQYWAMMDEVRVAFRDYYWKYGKSPYQEDEVVDKLPSNGGGDGNEDNNHQKLGFKDNAAAGGIDGFVKRCVFAGCKIKAMPLTNYCHPHILADRNQKLYKPCTYIIKSAQSGPIHCGKPILSGTVPSLCSLHFEKAQTHVTRALKKAGLNITSSRSLAPKLHCIVTESVRQINAKRKEQRGNAANGAVKQEAAS